MRNLNGGTRERQALTMKETLDDGGRTDVTGDG